jgi:hypothetical protein
MNPRIQELAEQAGWDTHHAQFDTRIEKFAQLIVQECAAAITDDDLAKDCGTFLMDSYAKGMRYSAHLIKEHFGVE